MSDICECNHHKSQHYNNFITGSVCRVCDCKSFKLREIEPEDAEALRMKQLLEDLALFPVEMEMDFYKTCVKFINGEEAYLPNILDYEEVTT